MELMAMMGLGTPKAPKPKARAGIKELRAKYRDAGFFYVACFAAVVHPEGTPSGEGFRLYFEQGPFDTTLFVGEAHTGEALIIGHKGPKQVDLTALIVIDFILVRDIG